MNHPPLSTHRSPERSFKRSCAIAYGSLAVGWAIGAAIVSLVLWQLTEARQVNDPLQSEALVIAVASGVIASLAMLPSLLTSTGKTSPVTCSADRWSGISAAMMAGTVIRMIGTVALFLTCRYHMTSTTEMIAAMTIGWYVLLTAIEVIVLGRVLPDVAGRSGHPVVPEPLKGTQTAKGMSCNCDGLAHYHSQT
jgi:hypothetical protein